MHSGFISAYLPTTFPVIHGAKRKHFNTSFRTQGVVGGPSASSIPGSLFDAESQCRPQVEHILTDLQVAVNS